MEGRGTPAGAERCPRRVVRARKYGVNKGRFWVVPGLGFRGYALNTSRPLFRNNVELRQAVNFAIDRSELEGGAGLIHAGAGLLQGGASGGDARFAPL